MRFVIAAACGVALLALALVVGDGDYHATAIGWAPFIGYVIAVAGAALYTRVLKNRVHAKAASGTVECERGKTGSFSVSVENRSPLFIFSCRLHFCVSTQDKKQLSEAIMSITLGPFQSTNVPFEAMFDHVGVYEVGVNALELSDYLGLFRANQKVHGSMQAQVLPAIHPVGAISFSQDAVNETPKAAKAILADSMDYSHVREYALGDPLKTIHWKLSARTGQFQTRLYEVYTSPGVAIIMDFHTSVSDYAIRMHLLDAIVEASFSIAYYASQQGIEWQLSFCDKNDTECTIRDTRTLNTAKTISKLPSMSDNHVLRDSAFDMVRKQAVSRYGQSNLILCTSDLDSEAVSSLIEAKMHRRAAMLVAIVPAELTGRARDEYLKPLASLTNAGVPFVAISSAEELSEMGRR